MSDTWLNVRRMEGKEERMEPNGEKGGPGGEEVPVGRKCEK